MTGTTPSTPSPPSQPWAERAADRSPSVQRSRTRSLKHTRVIIDAARRLIDEKGTRFTTQDLVKEAHVALQTFYRHFAGKDQLLVAVLGDYIAEASARYEEEARGLAGPVARIHFYLTAILRGLDSRPSSEGGPQFITAEHWRLHQVFPDEMAEATRPFTELVLREIREAVAAGQLSPADPERAAWHVSQLAMVVYHHYAFARTDETVEEISDHLWQFCLGALGGPPSSRQSQATASEDPS